MEPAFPPHPPLRHVDAGLVLAGDRCRVDGAPAVIAANWHPNAEIGHYLVSFDDAPPVEVSGHDRDVTDFQLGSTTRPERHPYHDHPGPCFRFEALAWFAGATLDESLAAHAPASTAGTITVGLAHDPFTATLQLGVTVNGTPPQLSSAYDRDEQRLRPADLPQVLELTALLEPLTPTGETLLAMLRHPGGVTCTASDLWRAVLERVHATHIDPHLWEAAADATVPATELIAALANTST